MDVAQGKRDKRSINTRTLILTLLLNSFIPTIRCRMVSSWSMQKKSSARATLLHTPAFYAQHILFICAILSRKNVKCMRVLTIIPARYGSTRFPAKLLFNIMGKSVLQRTYEAAKKSTLIDTLLVACDDQRIFEHVKSFGGDAIMTSISCKTGTDRIIEAMQSYCHASKFDVILNIQGDEPCIPKETIDITLQAIENDPKVVMATAACQISDHEEFLRPSVVKVVCDQQKNALYFSRSPIPYMHASKQPTALKHLGIYAYRSDFLTTYGTIKQTPLQCIEDLEQLKVLEAGYKIRVVEVACDTPHVDIPEDIQRVEKWLYTQQNLSL